MYVYQVKAGDTLREICRLFEVSEAEVIDVNDLLDPDVLAVGQALILPTLTHPYVVEPGETLGQIANRLGESLSELYADNPTLRSRALMAGETIFVRSAPPRRGALEVNGYAYPFIDTGRLEKTLPHLTYLTIFSYGVSVAGELVPTEDEALLAAAKNAGVAPIMLLSTIGRDGAFNSEAARVLLESETLQTRLIEKLKTVLNEKGYYGIDVENAIDWLLKK